MRARHRSTCAVFIVAFAACGKDSTAPASGPPPGDIAGTWTFAEQLGSGQVVCNDAGTLDFSQSNADLTGTASQVGSCTTPGGTIDNSGSGALTGHLGATTIDLAFGDCNYHGTLFHTPADSADGTVECPPAGPTLVALTGTWYANYQPPPPTVRGSLAIPPGDTLVVTGEKVQVTIGASDQHGLRWVGYSLSPPASVQDSVAVHDTTFADTIHFTVPASWDGTSYLRVWARNAYNKLGEATPAHVQALDAIRRPYQTAGLGVRAADAVYDPSRNVMYFSEPDSARVAVLALGTFTFGSPIRLPMIARGYGFQSVDILPGGDTAIVPLPDTAQLAFLDRIANSVTTSRLNGISGGLDLLRATVSRKVLTIGQVDSAGYIFFAVVERDLATGRDSIRRDVGQMGHVNITATLWGSPDHSKVLILSIGAPSCGYVYDAATDAFSSCSSFGFSGSEPATATTSGDKWLVGDELLDGSLNLLATVGNGGAGISPDGSMAYVPALYGYNKIALPAGTLLERVRLTAPISVRITVFPDGTRLFLWDDSATFSFGTYHATVVDLTH